MFFLKKIGIVVLMTFLALGLASCDSKPASTGGGTTNNTTAPSSPTGGAPVSTPTSSPIKLVLTTTATSLKSDGSNTADIVATVLDAGNAVVANAQVQFVASGGQISASSGLTGADGRATVTLQAGATKFNQVATVTATLVGVTPTVTSQIPVSINGTTVALTSQTTNITDSGSIQDTLTVVVKDAGNQPVYNAPVTITKTAGNGGIVVNQQAVNTDVNGTVTATITGTAAGSATITVTAAGATATQTYNVTATGAAFGIVSPVADPYGLSAGTPLTVQVNAPGITTVTFAASSGLWNGLTKVLDVPVTAGIATATFSSTLAGIVSIQVFDKASPTTLDTMRIAVAQPASAAAQVTLQSNTNVVAPSSAGVSNVATLTATVRDVYGQIVAGAPVNFEIPRPSGGGEFISPVLAYTDSFGKAQTTFTAGSIGTGAQGVDIYASIVGKAIPPSISNIVVGGTAGSVVIGTATKVIEISPTQYSMPMSVQVVDSNGNGVPNVPVSLKVWPKFYAYGAWYSTSSTGTASDCVSVKFKTPLGLFIPNEDINRNLTLDPFEDRTLTPIFPVASIDSYGVVYSPYAFAAPANDGTLTPASSASGSLPATVTTDGNGVANFQLDFLKNYATWIVAEITASTQVFGTETSAVLEYTLDASKADAAACVLPNSPFNEGAWAY